MNPEHAVQGLARRQQSLVTRSQAIQAGMTDHEVDHRIESGYWRRLHGGVYKLGVGAPTWEEKLMAATLAAGQLAAVSHRAAAVLWRMDGPESAPIEITIAHGGETKRSDVLCYRSRTLKEADITLRTGIPVTIVERTLVDLGRHWGDRSVEIALESALRRGLTTPTAVERYLASVSSRVPGHRVIKRVLAERGLERPSGSAAEVALDRALRAAGVAEPRRQYRLNVGGGQVVVIDKAWPELRVGLEVDGYAYHGGRLAHASDLERQNAIVRVGWLLLRYSGSQVNRDPFGIATEVATVLATRDRLAG